MPVFETPGSVSLHVRLPNGRVRVTTADEPRTSVELVSLGRRGADALEEVDVRVEERPGGHVVTIEQTARFRWGPIQITWDDAVEARITCPRGADLELSAASADLQVEGELGEVSARTASGDVSLGDVGRKLQVKTASGDVTVGRIDADASLVTVSGELEVAHVNSSLTARAVSGDVHLGVVAGALSLSTTSGDVRLDRVEAGEVRVQTVSGDARIGVGRGVRVWIDAASVSGDLQSELGLADDVPAESEAADAEADSVVPLHVKTVSGDVKIVRASEAA